jgi:hypothetical protein
VSTRSAEVFSVTPVGHWIEPGSFAAYRTGLLTFGQTEIGLTAGGAHQLEVPAGTPMEFVETGGIEGIPVESPVGSQGVAGSNPVSLTGMHSALDLETPPVRGRFHA